jgi:hypothetical protein
MKITSVRQCHLLSGGLLLIIMVSCTCREESFRLGGLAICLAFEQLTYSYLEYKVYRGLGGTANAIWIFV